MKLSIALESIIAISRRSLILIDVVKHRACAIEFSCYYWANILHSSSMLFTKKFELFPASMLRLLLQALVRAKLSSIARLLTLTF